jgi:secondary thiamine-phosphate synthase enzyme
MPVINETIRLSRTTENQMVDITSNVSTLVDSSPLNDGICTIFNIGSTGALTTIEFEPGLETDFPAMLERIAPKDIGYKHDLTWQDGNGHSHCKASLLGPHLTIPFVNKSLTLGTWQQIVFIELDNKPHQRNLIVQLIGE